MKPSHRKSTGLRTRAISETIETSTKRCSKCKETKPIAEFNKDASSADGLQWGCRTCLNAAKRASYRADPTKKLAAQRAYELVNRARRKNINLKRYGITYNTWNTIFEAQGSRCIITQETDPGSRSGWATDHCHGGNFVRGILTPAANCALGYLKDDPINFASALLYLAVNGKRMTPEEWEQFCAAYSSIDIQLEN